MGGFAR